MEIGKRNGAMGRPMVCNMRPDDVVDDDDDDDDIDVVVAVAVADEDEDEVIGVSTNGIIHL